MQQPLNNLRSVVTDSNEDKPRNGKLETLDRAAL